MNLVDFWSESDEDFQSRIALILGDTNENDLLYFIQGGLYPEISYAYRLSDNGKDFQDLILDYIAASHFTEKELINHDWKSQTFKLWIELKKCLQDFDIRGYVALSNEFKKSLPPILKESERLINFFDEVSKTLVNPYVALSIYGDTESSHWKGAWWKTPPNSIIANLKSLHTRIIKHPFPTALVQPIKVKIEAILGHLNSINQSLQNDWLMISALFFNAARINQLLGNYNLSLLLQHRCLDFYLQYFCISQQLIARNSNDEIFYTSKAGALKDTKITVINSLTAIQNNSLLATNSARDYFISRLNNTRNSLLHTHNVYSIKQEESNIFLNDLQTHILSIDGSPAKWKSNLSELNLYLNIPITSIFDIEDSFDTYIVKIYQK